jgi:hypothetical protein
MNAKKWPKMIMANSTGILKTQWVEKSVYGFPVPA